MIPSIRGQGNLHTARDPTKSLKPRGEEGNAGSEKREREGASRERKFLEILIHILFKLVTAFIM